ncbi:MAG: hypothetical protein PF961_00625 [Planctomycetota bacterium]|jgi:hypothetical protein|nr:hypothetical protein [Planctomycetota bacterium]
MNLDEMSIVVRERSMSEVYDLTVVVIRRHLRDLMILTVLAGAPLAAVNWWLLHEIPAESGGAWYPLLALLAIETPFFSAVITAYLGQAMFSHHPSKRAALRQAGSRVLSLIAVSVVRLLLMPLLVTWLFMPVQWVEVLVLERMKGTAAMKRANNLANFYRAENIMHTLLSGIGGVVLLILLVLGAREMVNLLQIGMSVEVDYIELLNPASLWVLALIWPVVMACTAQRFCAYLDLRTKREGWAVELEVRRAGARIRTGGL